MTLLGGSADRWLQAITDDELGRLADVAWQIRKRSALNTSISTDERDDLGQIANVLHALRQARGFGPLP